MFAAARDVTERQLLDQALRETNVALESARFAAEKANLAKLDFLSSMSHELRSPLNAILGFAQLIDSGSPTPTPNQKSSVDQILQAGWYLLELINEILDLALIESGKLSLSKEPLSLGEVLADCEAMIEPQAQTSGIRVGFPQFDHPCYVSADRTRTKHILINPPSNAIKYNRAGGQVDVKCSVTAAQRMRISVHHTGQGLLPEKLGQLFQPFNRPGQEGGEPKGTGIGLVVSKRLVELMGGEIGAESQVGVGSVFWIELDSSAAPQLGAESVQAKAAAGQGLPVQSGVQTCTLLCVEDNPANLMLIEKLVARRPEIRLLSARDGTLGIKIALVAGARRHPDGHQFARHHRHPGSETPGHGPGNGAYSGDRAQRQRHAPRHRKRSGGGILPLPHQTDPGGRVDGHAGPRLQTRGEPFTPSKIAGRQAMIAAHELLSASILIVDDQPPMSSSSSTCCTARATPTSPRQRIRARCAGCTARTVTT